MNKRRKHGHDLCLWPYRSISWPHASPRCPELHTHERRGWTGMALPAADLLSEGLIGRRILLSSVQSGRPVPWRGPPGVGGAVRQVHQAHRSRHRQWSARRRYSPAKRRSAPMLLRPHDRVMTERAILLLVAGSFYSASWTACPSSSPACTRLSSSCGRGTPSPCRSSSPSGPPAAWPGLLRCERPALQAGAALLPVLANATAVLGARPDAAGGRHRDQLRLPAPGGRPLGPAAGRAGLRPGLGRGRVRVRWHAGHYPARRRYDRLGGPASPSPPRSCSRSTRC